MNNWRIGLFCAGLGLATAAWADLGTPATLPLEYAGANGWSNANLDAMAGWDATGLAAPYTGTGASAKFDTAGDNLIIRVDSAPGELVYSLRRSDAAALTNTFEALVQESDSTNSWTNVRSFNGSELNGTLALFTNQLADSSRYVRFIYSTKPTGQNLGLGYVKISPSAGAVTNVRFTASSAIVDENVGIYPVTIYKNRAEGDVSGSVFLLGTASNGIGADYTLDTTNFTLNGTTTSAVVNITVNDDAEAEGAETIILSLFGVTGATTTSPDVFTLTINPSDQATYAIGITPPTNGTVTTTPASNATAGATVTINATADSGYTVGTKTVVAADASPVTVTGNTFTMPAQAVTVTVTFVEAAASRIVISQYTETDSGSVPKGIEIWNVSGADITFDASTNLLDVKVGSAGGAPASVVTANSGTLTAGAVWIIGTSDMTPNVEETFLFNGDDAVVLELGGVVQDVIGMPGVDPGTAWTSNGVSTVNQNIQLKTGITAGDPDGWSDPSVRYEYVAVGSDLTGFGIPPGGAAATNVHFTASAAAVAESTGTYAVTVIKTLTGGDVSGTVALSGTATEGAGADYTVDTTNFTLNGTTTSAVFTVTINNDTNEEAAETIVLTLANVAGGTISAPSVFTLTINANDTVIVPEGLAAFRFQTDPYLPVSTKDADLTVTDMALSAGTIETAIITGDYFPNEPYVEETGGWTNAAQAGAKAFVFTVTPASGKTLTIDGIFFRAYATAAGPTAYGFDIGGGLATYAVDAPSNALLVVSQAVAGVTGQTGPVEIRIQGWLNGSRTSTGAGVFRLDDVVIYGTLSGGTPAAPSIEPITFVAGTGFRFPVPSNYTLNAVYGADAELTAGGEWTWSALNAPGDYSEAGGVVTITTTNAVRRMIRIGVIAAP